MKNTKYIVITSLGMAIVFLMTLLHIPLPMGYINVGDSALLLFASFLNPPAAFLVGGVGSALADLYLGYSQYAVFTLLIKGSMGAFIAFYLIKVKSKHYIFIPYSIAAVWMVIGYFLVDWLLYGNAMAVIPAVQANLLQASINVCIAYPVYQSVHTTIAKYLIN